MQLLPNIETSSTRDDAFGHGAGESDPASGLVALSACYFSGRFAPEIPDEEGIRGDEDQRPQKPREHGPAPSGAYRAAAWASNRALRRVAKRSETAGGTVELVVLTDAIRASGFCGMRFAHVRAWATTNALRSAPQWRQR